MDATDITFREEDHSYHRGLQRLTSVTQVIKTAFPSDGYDGVSPAVLENARERGVEVDMLFSAYLDGWLTEYPSGIREDSEALLDKLIPWWDKQGFGNAETQVRVADDEIAGTIDILAPGWILDLKTVYELKPTYRIQLGGYADLYADIIDTADKRGPLTSPDIPELGIIHVTARMREPKLVRYPRAKAVADWRTVRAMWKLLTEATK